MANHDLIVIGGSAGAIDPLTTIVQGLPSNLPAAVCVVVHTAPYFPSRLAMVLERAGALPAVEATQGAALKNGVIFTAPPDQHLLIEPGRIRLAHGPRENRTRPAIDPLFRSAALHYGSRVTGLILSGALDDGTPGLWTVKDRGGIAVVQDPDEALVKSMPTSAVQNVAVDYVLPAGEIPAMLVELCRHPVETRPVLDPRGNLDDLKREVAMAALDEDVHWNTERYGVPSRFACPDCGGVLWLSSANGPLTFRCEVGHAYSGGDLAEGQTNELERALWAAVRALEDTAELAALRAAGARDRGTDDVARRLAVQREAAQAHAAVIRELLRSTAGAAVPPET